MAVKSDNASALRGEGAPPPPFEGLVRGRCSRVEPRQLQSTHSIAIPASLIHPMLACAANVSRAQEGAICSAAGEGGEL